MIPSLVSEAGAAPGGDMAPICGLPPATSISYKTDAFPLPSDVYFIYSMFLCYYVAWPWDLDLWPFDLESVSCTVLLVSVHIPISIILWLSVTELRSDHISVIWNSHCACAVSRDLWPGAKIVHIFDPKLPIHFVTFTALRQRLSHFIGKT